MYKNQARKSQRRYDVQTAMQSSWPMVPLDPMAMPPVPQRAPDISLNDQITQSAACQHEPTALADAFVQAIGTETTNVINLQHEERKSN